MKILFISLLLSVVLNCNAQNILKFNENTFPVSGTLKDVSWIQGHWRGEAFGGVIEEIWSPPLGDSMMFSFKLVADDKVVFYELGGIRQIEETLIFQLKHFGNDFKGWEERDETVDARLVKIEGNRAYFDQFTFEKVNDNEMNIYVVIEEKGQEEEIKFNYKRY